MSTINQSHTNRKWWAMIRLICYLWILALLYVLEHYEPEYLYLLEPAANVMYFAIGLLLGRNRGLIRSVRQSNT